MENKIGVIKEFDSLGRLVIPKKMRDLFKFEKEIELVITENGVLVRNPKYQLTKKDINSDSLQGQTNFEQKSPLRTPKA